MPTSRQLAFALAVIAAIAIGCGTSNSAGGASCESVCEKINLAKCPNAGSDCVASCQNDINTTPLGCKSKIDALTSCFASSTFSCGTDGTPEAASCATQLDAWSACTDPADAGASACPAETGDSVCATCTKASCCTELSACAANAACLDFSDCVRVCTDATCVQACAQVNASGAQVYLPFATCAQNKCSGSCGSVTAVAASAPSVAHSRALPRVRSSGLVGGS